MNTEEIDKLFEAINEGDVYSILKYFQIFFYYIDKCSMTYD